MHIEDINPPLIEPLELDYTKTFLRVDGDDENTLIGDLISSARQRVEALIGTSLITRRRVYRSDKIYNSTLFVNHSPIVAIHAVHVRSEDGEVTEIALENISINLKTKPVSLRTHPRRDWASFGSDICQVEVELGAGYGEDPSDIPMPIRQAMLLLIADAYEHRGQGDRPAVPMMVDALLMPYRGLRL